MKIAFYKGRRSENSNAKLFDIAVAWWTGGLYSHCELVFNDSPKEASCYSSSNRDGGVRFKTIDLTSGHWDVVDLHSFDENAAWRWFTKHHGQPYDVAGLFGFVLPWRTQNPNHWFCSEACAAALGISNPSKISPNHLAEYIRINDKKG